MIKELTHHALRLLTVAALSTGAVACGGDDGTPRTDAATTPSPAGQDAAAGVQVDTSPSAPQDAEPAPADGPATTDKQDAMTSSVADARRHDTGTSPLPTSDPAQLEVAASLDGVKATHVKSTDGTKMHSALFVTADPTFTPKLALTGRAPDINKAARFTIQQPAAGGCTVLPQFSLNETQISLSLVATDVLPATACATYADKIAAQGMVVVFEDAPYGRNSVAKQVKLTLRP
jgi:hypothetical protein